MDSFKEVIFPIIIGLLASSGFWVFLERVTQKRTLQNELLLAVSRDRIVRLGLSYLARSWISQEEFEDLNILYQAYSAMGGNGSAKRVMQQVEKLPMRRDIQQPGRVQNPDSPITGDTLR